MMMWRSLRPREIATALRALERVLRKRTRKEWAAREESPVGERERQRVDEATEEISNRT